MRRTIAMTATMVTMMMAGAIVALAPAASGQTGYPPGLCAPADTVFDAGTHEIGDTFTVRLVPVCLWTPGADVATTANGQSVGTKVADAAGGIDVTVTVRSATQLSIDDPVLVASQCGENNVSGIGPSAAAGGVMVRSTAIFRVNCDGPTAAAPRAGRAGIVAFTGANVVGWGALALGLLVGGSLLVIAARRRRAAGA